MPLDKDDNSYQLLNGSDTQTKDESKWIGGLAYGDDILLKMKFYPKFWIMRIRFSVEPKLMEASGFSSVVMCVKLYYFNLTIFRISFL